jgi:hypothetical protein
MLKGRGNFSHLATQIVIELKKALMKTPKPGKLKYDFYYQVISTNSTSKIKIELPGILPFAEGP